MEPSDDGFISRWSRRKARVREGLAPAEPSPTDSAPAASTAEVAAAQPTTPPPAKRQAADQPAAPPLPTLHDVALLTRESDYSRFVAPGVGPDVRNAAMKKLFSDPHFNVMDGLDTYIDDYGKPDPLASNMLRKMVQAQALGLFENDIPGSAGTSQAPGIAHEGSASDENPDLRLQPNDAAGCQGPGQGPVEDPAGIG